MQTPVLSIFCAALALVRFNGPQRHRLYRYPLMEYTARASWLIEAIAILSVVLDTVLVLALCY